MAKQSEAQITYAQVFEAAKRIHAEWQRWMVLDGPRVPHPETLEMTKGMSQELHVAITEGVDATADAPTKANVDPKARRLMLCLDEIGREFLRWLQGISAGLSICGPVGTPDLLDSLRRLHDAMTERPLPPPPSVTKLLEMGANHTTIALKYGWMTEGGPDVYKVLEEIENPGTHYDPKTWISPRDRGIQVETDSQWKERKARPRYFQNARAEAEAPKPKIRSIEELLAAGAPASQIAHLQKIDEFEAFELIKEYEAEKAALSKAELVPAK